MTNASGVVKPGHSSSPNPFHRFYQSWAFDMMFGAIPAILTGLYCLFIIFPSATHLSWTVARWISVKYLLTLSLIGFHS